MIKTSCPNCGAVMEVDENREFAFCTYCGTKIILKSNVEINRSAEINNLLFRAHEYEEKKDYARAIEYCNHVLDIDSKNEIARIMEQRLLSYIPKDNVIIKYNSSLKDKFKLRITIDGKNWYTIDPNNELSFELPKGEYRILFSGTRNYTRNITISDTKKIIEIIYIAEKHRNEIIIN